MEVTGRRFTAFLPLGDKRILESHILFFAEAYRWSPEQVLKIESARRFRLVSRRSDIVEEKNRQMAAAHRSSRTRR